MKAVAVFCGSSAGTDPEYESDAFALGASLASRGITLVYGGANLGLMGAVAKSALSKGGRVVGVLPRDLQGREPAYEGCFELIWANSMHERKAIMYQKSEGFITLPGGLGTMDETMEALTWSLLGIHDKPGWILNTRGFYNFMPTLLDTMVSGGFLKESYKDKLMIFETVPELITAMAAHPSYNH